MILVLVNNLKEEMTIAKPVVIQGKTLLTAGAQLSAKHIQILKAWGISDVWIEGSSELNDNSIDLDSEEFYDIKTKLDARFSKCIENDIIKELKRIITIRECVKLKSHMEHSEGNLRE
jgi:hypothetical protein